MSALKHKLMCLGCDTKLNKSVDRKKLVSDEVESNAFSPCLKRRIAVDYILCNKCRLFIYRNNSDKDSDCETEPDLSPSDATSDDLTFEVKVKSKEALSETEYFEIPIQRTVATHKYCCICFSMKNSTVIPEDGRIQSYIKKNIFIPPGNRCCTTNILKNRIYEEYLGHLKEYSNTASLSASELSKVIEILSIKCDLTLLDKIGEFSLSEKQIKIFTGLSWENLLEIKGFMTSSRNSQSRSVIQALIVFLFKLRTENYNKLFKKLFDV